MFSVILVLIWQAEFYIVVIHYFNTDMVCKNDSVILLLFLPVDKF